jgi:hypothetical protein
MEIRKWSEEQRTEATAIIQRAVAVQESRKLTDRRMVTEFPDLGSTKTWRHRLVAQDFKGLNPERTIERLRRFKTILEGGLPDAVFYRDLPFAQEVVARVGALESCSTDRRILVILAPNGCGKSSVAKWCVHQAREQRAYCRLRPGWRNKELHIANGIAAALGSADPAANASGAEQRLIEMLVGHPRTVFLDQAHEGGPALMHLLRVLIDETESRFVYLGYDTAFRRVQTANSDAMIEAQAFLGRCQKPIFNLYKSGTQNRDVSVYLQRAADLNKNAADGVATRIGAVLAQHTNLRLLDDAIQSARAANDIEDEADPDKIVAEVFRLAGATPETLRGQEN